MCVALLIMVVGYAAFSTQLKINGTANIASNWNVVFTKIEKISSTSGVTEKATPTASGTTATFNVNLKSPGDVIEYQITVENKGTLDAIIENIEASELGSDAFKFEISNIKKGDKLAKGTTTNFKIKIRFDESVTSQPTLPDNKLTVNIKYVQDIGQVITSENVNIEGPIITNLAGVNNVKLPNSVGRNLINYKIYGNTLQSGTPSPDAPVSLTYLGNDGNITVESINNLVKNGYGELGDNTTFPNFTYSSDSPNSDIKGSFYRASNINETVASSEYISIDPNKSYNYSAYAKNTGTGTDAIFYMGLVEYDIDKNAIFPDHFMYVSNTLTTLTKDLKNGDTVVYLDNISNFQVDSATPGYQLGFIFWNYKDSTGYTYPELTYSRNVYNNLFTYDKVDKTNHTLTLKTPWNHGTISKGTKLSQSSQGSTYNYSLLGGRSLPPTWTKYSATIRGNKTESFSSFEFRPGTKYVRFLLLNNHNSKADVKTHIAGVRLVESDYDNVETINLSGHPPLRKVGSSADYIDYENKRIVRNTWEYTLTGDEVWMCYTNNGGDSIHCYFSAPVLSTLTGGKEAKNNSSILSTHYPYTNLGQSNSNYPDRSGNGIYGYSDYTASFIITTNKATSTETWKSYLKAQASKGTPVKVLYELKTPVYENIDLPSIGTGKGDSTFTVLGGISPSNIELNYQKSK